VVEARGLEAAENAKWDKKSKDYDELIARLTQDVEWAEANNTGKDAPAAKKSKY
jgi:hypothetical protein